MIMMSAYGCFDKLRVLCWGPEMRDRIVFGPYLVAKLPNCIGFTSQNITEVRQKRFNIMLLLTFCGAGRCNFCLFLRA